MFTVLSLLSTEASDKDKSFRSEWYFLINPVTISCVALGSHFTTQSVIIQHDDDDDNNDDDNGDDDNGISDYKKHQ